MSELGSDRRAARRAQRERSGGSRAAQPQRAAVLVACLVVGTYLYVNDFVWKHVVSRLLLGQ